MATKRIRLTEWRGDEFLAKLKAEESKRLERAAIFLKNEIKSDLSEGVKREGGTVVGRSAPGEPPALDEGELRRSMAHEVEGPDIPQGLCYRLGAPRPMICRDRPAVRAGFRLYQPQNQLIAQCLFLTIWLQPDLNTTRRTPRDPT